MGNYFGAHIAKDIDENCFCTADNDHTVAETATIKASVLSGIDLHDASQKGHRRGHQNSLLISGQAFKACNVDRRTLIWDQSGDH